MERTLERLPARTPRGGRPLPLLTATPACAAAPAPAADVLVLETRFGAIAIQLFPKDVPRTVENIRKLAAEGFYDGLTFHRVRPGFVLQGGDPNSRNENPFDDGRGGPPYKLPAEIHRTHTKGSVAMAREGADANPKRESNGSQFYIALRDLPHLDGAYTVFGQVLSDWTVIDSLVAQANAPDIARVGVEANPGALTRINRARVTTLTAWKKSQANAS